MTDNLTDNKTKPKYVTREQWLEAAVELIRPWFKSAGTALPPRVRVSVGFPFGSRKALAQCFHAKAAEDRVRQIFVSPVMIEPKGEHGLLVALVHELCHSALPDDVGHRRPFQKLAGDLGLEKPWTASPGGPDLVRRLNVIANSLGAFPHSRLSPGELLRKKQSTRMIKCTCGKCGYVARTSAKWINEVGAPLCPVKGRGQMFADLPDEEDDGEGED